ncbi:unnamed protein product [Didymodactylos carnosus]|uniref:Uncharacterized protein n=1 Tax=Didymodactylos carnosus TaxID=1234261 RepID=A0A8S2G682_9BILA|nr:unnamed protein product [Didymodactylos carnosus]CAF4472588.1 unnamed protein product [Didymodactylos carnosus]
MVHVLQQMFEQNKQNVDIENLKSKSKFKNSEPLFVKKKNGAKTTTTVSSSMPQIAKKSLDDGKSSNGKYVHSQPILNNLLSSKLNRIPLPVNNFIRKTIIQSKSKRLIDDQQQPQSTKRMKLQDDNRTMSDRQSPSSSSSSSCSSLSLSCKSTKPRFPNEDETKFDEELFCSPSFN